MKICYVRRPKSGNGRLRDFASKMSPFLFRFLAVARLTHFHRSGTWLAPTDISQTFYFAFLGLSLAPSHRTWIKSKQRNNKTRPYGVRTFVGWGGRPKGEPTKVDEIRDFANYIG